MLSTSFLIAALSLICVPVAFSSDVIELTDGTFESELNSKDFALVMFYAPWCGHCKKLKPEFEKAATTLIAHDPPAHLAKIDCTEAGKEKCGEFSVSGYPTLKFFANGEFVEEYNGPRDVDGIVKHVTSKLGPASRPMEDVSKLGAYLDSQTETAVVVAYSFQTEKSGAAFKAAAKAMRDSVNFAHLTDGNSAEAKAAIEQLGSPIVIYRPAKLQSTLEPRAAPFVDGAKEFTKADLVAWIKKERNGLAGHRTHLNVADFDPAASGGKHLLIAFFDVDFVRNAKGTNYWRNRIMKVGKEYVEDGLRFAISNSNDFSSELSNSYGIEYMAPDSKPRVAIQAQGKKKYVMEAEFSVDALKTFIKDFLAGNLVPYLKSEDEPTNNDAKGVKVAVAKNFNSLVIDNDKDVLIEFYAPWCGHCKKLAPIYDELGDKLKDEPSVLVAKMDATANDVPEQFTVTGFPTIYWVPAGHKMKPERYEGGRELDDFVKFIAKKSTVELTTFDREGKAKKSEL